MPELSWGSSLLLHAYAHRRLQARACPGIVQVISKHCVLISQGPDAKTNGVPSDQHKCAYARTDVHIALQCSDNTLLQLCIKCGVAKFCPGTHSALQVPMLMHAHKAHNPNLYSEAVLVYSPYHSKFPFLVSFTSPESGLAMAICI